MKDYYEILGVTRKSSGKKIRQQYRMLAMKYHPDRRPDSADAEQRFKEIAEAYGVLTDPVKRNAYDSWCRTSGASGGERRDFSYSQEQIFKDLFKDPKFQQLFGGLLREFQRAGFRASSHFVRKSFFGGTGGVFFGGLVFLGSLAGPALLKTATKRLPRQRHALQRMGKRVVNNLLKNTSPFEQDNRSSQSPGPADIVYAMSITSEELVSGKRVQIVAGDEKNHRMLELVIPAGSRGGQRLKLRGKGREVAGQRGDLYLELVEDHQP